MKSVYFVLFVLLKFSARGPYEVKGEQNVSTVLNDTSSNVLTTLNFTTEQEQEDFEEVREYFEERVNKTKKSWAHVNRNLALARDEARRSLSGIANHTKSLWTQFVSMGDISVQGVRNYLHDLTVNFWQRLKDSLTRARDNVKKGLVSIQQAPAKGWKKVSSWFKGAWRDTREGVGGFFEKVGRKMQPGRSGGADIADISSEESKAPMDAPMKEEPRMIAPPPAGEVPAGVPAETT